MGEQKQNLERVSAKISAVILGYFDGLLKRSAVQNFCPQFHMDDLAAFVQVRMEGQGINIAPDSTSRIMRNMRQRGLLNYKVISRGESLYQVLGVADGR
jgi:hypothetical protein